LYVDIPDGKKEKHALEDNLEIMLNFIWKHLKKNHRILIHCNQGINRSVATCCAVLTAFFNAENELQTEPIDKSIITKKYYL